MTRILSTKIPLILCFLIIGSSPALAQWNEISTWFNQAVKDVEQAGKDVENTYNQVNKEIEKTTLTFVKDIETFATEFANSTVQFIGNCKVYSGDVYTLIKTEADKESAKYFQVNKTVASDLCDECIKNATLQFICRVPETIQGNMAFMDKMQAIAKVPPVSDLASPNKEIAAVALAAYQDFSNEFTYYFNLLTELVTELDKQNQFRASNLTKEQILDSIFSKSNCEGLGDQAFDAMMGGLKDKASRERTKKRYAALLKMIKGFEKMETISGLNDDLNTLQSLFPENKAANGMPTENLLFSSSGAENVFINATENGLWVDARNWSKQMVPLPYQIAYIPKGKKAKVDRPITVRAIIDNNPNKQGISVEGTGQIAFTENTNYYNGHTFAIQAKHSGHYLAINGDSKVDGGTVITWDNPNHGSHHYQFVETEDGDGSYYIFSQWSGLPLDVFGPSVENGATLGQWSWQKWNNQKFFLDEAGGGYYYIRSKHSGKVIDVNGCNKGKGIKVQQWDKVPVAECQMFKLVPKTLAGRTFILESKMGGKVIDKNHGNNVVHLWDKHGGVNQKFMFQLAELEGNREWYYLINKENQGYLHNQGYGVMNLTPMTLLTEHKFGNDWATMYGLIPNGDGYYYIQSRFGKYVNGKWEWGRVLDASGCKNVNGSRIILYDKIDGANCQLWKLTEVD